MKSMSINDIISTINSMNKNESDKLINNFIDLYQQIINENPNIKELCPNIIDFIDNQSDLIVSETK